MINVAILGCTGSIGEQTLNVIRRYPRLFRVSALCCGTNAEILIKQANEFKPDFVAISDESKANELKVLNYGCKIYAGRDAQKIAGSLDGVDVVVCAVVGLIGIEGVVSAIKSGKRVALANKESLVSCGKYVTELALKCGAQIIPVDSEHSAIYQCLKSANRADLRRLILTASGGPFRNENREFLQSVTPEQAVKHPNWKMGKKISVDSATMMNKGLEIIEAKWLFETEKIEYIIQPESIIHSMVEFNDGSVIAQIARPTMEMPIQYALSYPERLSIGQEKFYFEKPIQFFKPNEELFPMPSYCYTALKVGKTMPAIINSANECAVKLFLERKIGFLDIMKIVEHTLNNESAYDYTDYTQIVELHEEIFRKIENDYYKILEK